MTKKLFALVTLVMLLGSTAVQFTINARTGATSGIKETFQEEQCPYNDWCIAGTGHPEGECRE